MSRRRQTRKAGRQDYRGLLEDNPANLRLVEQLIARQPDIRLLTATTGMLSSEAARASQPDVVLMDINLPDISGMAPP
jgi:CheY-like chemotaxis protein